MSGEPTDPADLPRHDETWVAGSVAVHRWIITKRGRALRPDAFLVLSGAEVVGVRVVPEGPGPAATMDLLLEMMARPLTGEPRRPARILVAGTETAAHLRAALAPLGINAAPSDEVEAILTERIRGVERQAGGGFPLEGLLEVAGVTPDGMKSLLAAAAEFHRRGPWRRIPDGVPFEVVCDDWERPTWFASVLGSVGELRGLTLHPTWESLLDIYAGRAEDATADAVALAFGDRTQVPFADLDAIGDWDMEVDGTKAYPLVFRSRVGGDVGRPDAEELHVLEASLRAFAAFAGALPEGSPTAIVLVSTAAGHRQVRLRRREGGPSCP